MEAKTLVNTLADTLSETDVETINDTLANVKSEQLTYTLTDTLENKENRETSKPRPGFLDLATNRLIETLRHCSLRRNMLIVAEVETRCNK